MHSKIAMKAREWMHLLTKRKWNIVVQNEQTNTCSKMKNWFFLFQIDHFDHDISQKWSTLNNFAPTKVFLPKYDFRLILSKLETLTTITWQFSFLIQHLLLIAFNGREQRKSIFSFSFLRKIEHRLVFVCNISYCKAERGVNCGE